MVTLVVCQISDDLQYDSFFTRAAHDEMFKFLANLGVPMDVILQFSDNCGAQYKSRRPFADMARSPLNIIRVYFGERHGKSQCDGFFGRLKRFVTDQIKTRQAIIRNADDFFRLCKEKYEKAPIAGECNHYRVVFQLLKPEHIKRHHDFDLESAIPGTRSMYSVRNTSDPMKLKIRKVPCLCPPCIKDDGQKCFNYKHTDPWQEVKLQPKGRRKFTKKKNPCRNEENILDNEETPDESTEEGRVNKEASEDLHPSQNDTSSENSDEECVDLTCVHNERGNNVRDIFIDLTKLQNKHVQPWSDSDPDDFLTENDEIYKNDELPDLPEEHSGNLQSKKVDSILPTFEGLESNDIPKEILWSSLLSTMERCNTFEDLKEVVADMKQRIPRVKRRKGEVCFNGYTEYVDATAAADLPTDIDQDVHPIWIRGDGNCLCRSISRACYGDDSHHLELRVRIIIEGVANMDKYLDHELMKRGATLVRIEETIPETYARYSDHYISGQVMTEDSIMYMYCKELHDCAQKNAYMGLWQMAQAATVLSVPVRSVYPQVGDDVMRRDFHRTFYPIDKPPHDIYPISIMWTGGRNGFNPNHFVPLIRKPFKYAQSVNMSSLLVFYTLIV